MLTRENLVAFLKSDTRYKWRTLSAVSYRFGCTLADVDKVIGSHPGTFKAMTGRMGVLISVA